MIERANAFIKKVIHKSLKINKKDNFLMNLQNLVDNINHSQHAITRFTPNKIKKQFQKMMKNY